jgi:SAM-dependent methyltransferase
VGIVERYDRDAVLYDEHWQPVLDRASRRLLDRLAGRVDRASRGLDGVSRAAGRAPVLMDVGTGTGALAVAACERWPHARIVGLDPSHGMLAMARTRSARAGIAQDDGRLSWLACPAESIDLEDGSVDAAFSSFVLQLVPDRAPVLAELRRVLRPGGSLAFVTWLDRGPDFLPDVEFDEAVLDLGVEESEPEDAEVPRSGDFRSLRAAERELRSAGFHRLSVRAEWLEHAWTPEAYLAFKRSYDERVLYELLDERFTAELERLVLGRWAALPPDAFTLRAQLVSAVAVRP